jgi:TPP-dependent 2-oxoacid decarboxylase
MSSFYSSYKPRRKTCAVNLQIVTERVISDEFCCEIQVRTEDELTAAIATATGEQKDSLCFIEVFVHKDDTSKELLEWGSRVSAANGRPPNPQ